jgi:hypothetical protein
MDTMSVHLEGAPPDSNDGEIGSAIGLLTRNRFLARMATVVFGVAGTLWALEAPALANCSCCGPSPCCSGCDQYGFCNGCTPRHTEWSGNIPQWSACCSHAITSCTDWFQGGRACICASTSIYTC